MSQAARFPIRSKIFVAVLFIVTLVVTCITATMANLFQREKSAYMAEMAAVMALRLATEAEALLDSYANCLRLLAQLSLDARTGAGLGGHVQGLFAAFPDLLIVKVHDAAGDAVATYSAEDGLSPVEREDLLEFHQAHAVPRELAWTDELYVSHAGSYENVPLAMIAVTVADMVVVALVKLDSLLELARRSGAFEALVTDLNGNLLAHADAARLGGPPGPEWYRDKAAPDSQRRTSRYLRGAPQPLSGGLTVAVRVPEDAARLFGQEYLSNLVLLATGLFLAAALVTLVLSRRLTSPLERLTSAVRAVARGRYDVAVQTGADDEIGMLAHSFNQMASELEAREELLQHAHLALLRSEKMAAFGQLGAGIAHEVKNPLAGILGHAQLALRKLDQTSPVHGHLEIIERETKRCTQIISQLMHFARQEQADKAPVDVNSVAEDTLGILAHQLAVNGINIERDLGLGLPPVLGNANQLQQVILNFALNAQHAMEGRGGVLRLVTRLAGEGQVEIVVSDNGPGIPRDIQDKIFEPFFTTKPAGEGTGLGLSVTYGIIRDHDGRVRVESSSEGASFIVTLPACGEARAA